MYIMEVNWEYLIISPGTGHTRCSRWSKERHHNRLPVMKIINVDSMLIDINFFTFFVNTPECCTSVWPSAWAWRKRRTETRTSWPERRGHHSLQASPPRSRSDKGCSSSHSSLETICIYIYISTLHRSLSPLITYMLSSRRSSSMYLVSIQTSCNLSWFVVTSNM